MQIYYYPHGVPWTKLIALNSNIIKIIFKNCIFLNIFQTFLVCFFNFPVTIVISTRTRTYRIQFVNNLLGQVTAKKVPIADRTLKTLLQFLHFDFETNIECVPRVYRSWISSFFAMSSSVRGLKNDNDTFKTTFTIKLHRHIPDSVC